MINSKNNNTAVKTYVIDLFCGSGGTTTGIHESNTNIEVIACINHDKNAILSHKENYPNCLHFTEDIRTIELSPLTKLIEKLRKKDPTCKIAIWASLECQSFSKAKCGPKCADSRTLALDMYRYLDAINPDFFWVENVEEFKDWGPLDKDGNPDKSKMGWSYQNWIKSLTSRHFSKKYYQEILTASNYGARTIRKRLFLQFTKDDNEIGYPIETHSKKANLFLPKWLPVKDILDLNNHGASIFTRIKDFVENTHKRIYKGLDKFGHEEGTHFGYKYYGQGGYVDINDPMYTLTTKDRVSLVNVTPLCIKENFGTSTVRSLELPFSTLTTVPKGDVIFTKTISFVHNPQYGGSNRSINDPAATLIARQDKAPIGLTTAKKHELEVEFKSYGNKDRDHIEFKDGKVIYNTFLTDDEWMIKIKKYMFKHHIIDICVRPLTIIEMLQIQGFPKEYTLKGTMTERKKYIGNSVEVKVGVALFKAIDLAIQNNNQ